MSSFDSAAIQADLFAGNLFAEDVQADKSSLRFSDDFWMYKFKIHPCCKSYPHKWSLCPWAHEGETGRRRCTKTHSYKPFICPYVRKTEGCPYGPNCIYAHNVFEQWLHPAKYKTKLCCYGAKCMRPLCFFAHTVEELRPEDKKALQSRPRASNSLAVKVAPEDIPENDVKAICETASNVLETLLPRMSSQIMTVPDLLSNTISLDGESTKASDKRSSSSSLSPTLSFSKSFEGQVFGKEMLMPMIMASNAQTDQESFMSMGFPASQKVYSGERFNGSPRNILPRPSPSAASANNSVDNLVALLMMLQQRQNAQNSQPESQYSGHVPGGNAMYMLPAGHHMSAVASKVGYVPYNHLYAPTSQTGLAVSYPQMLL